MSDPHNLDGMRTVASALLAVITGVVAAWAGAGWFPALCTAAFAAAIAWSGITLMLTWTDLGSRRAARRELREAQRSNDPKRLTVARLRWILYVSSGEIDALG